MTTLNTDKLFAAVKILRETRRLVPVTVETSLERHDMKITEELLNDLLQREDVAIERIIQRAESRRHELALGHAAMEDER